MEWDRIAVEEKIPIVMLLSGGYQKMNASVIAESMINLNKKFSLLPKLEIKKSL